MKDGQTQALLDIAQRNRAEPCRKLQSARDVIGVAAKPGCSALVVAARRGQLALCASILRSGVDINARDENGMTALMLASRLDYPEICTLLLCNHADLHLTDNFGWTAEDHAASPYVLNILKKGPLYEQPSRHAAPD